MRKVIRLKDDARRHELREDWLKAIQSYEQVLAIGEKGETDLELPLYNRVGDLYVRIGRPNDAVRYYAQAADRYADAGLYNNAIALCNKALRYAPHHLDLLRKLGLFSASQGFLTDARRWFLDYAENAARQGRAEEALGALEEFANSTEDGEVREMLGRTLKQHGHHERAVTELRHAYRMYLGEGNATRADKVQAYLRDIAPDVSLAGEQPEAPRVRTRDESDFGMMSPLGTARQSETARQPEAGTGSGTAPEPEPEPDGALEGLMGSAVEDAGAAAVEDAGGVTEADVLEGFQPTSFETEPEDASAALDLPELETAGLGDAPIAGEIDVSFGLPARAGADEDETTETDIPAGLPGLEPTSLGEGPAEDEELPDDLPEEVAPLPLLGEEDEEDAEAGAATSYVVDEIELPTFPEPAVVQPEDDEAVESGRAEEAAARAALALDADEAAAYGGAAVDEDEVAGEYAAADEDEAAAEYAGAAVDADEAVVAYAAGDEGEAAEGEAAEDEAAEDEAAEDEAAEDDELDAIAQGLAAEQAAAEAALSGVHDTVPAVGEEAVAPGAGEEEAADEFASFEAAAGAAMEGFDLPLLEEDGEAEAASDPAQHVHVDNTAYIIAEVVGAARAALKRDDVAGAVGRLLTLHQQLRDASAYAHAVLELGGLVALRPKEVRLHQVRVELAERSGEHGLRLDAYLALAAALEEGNAPGKAAAIYEHVLEMEPGNAAARGALEALQRRRQPEYVDLKSLLGLDEPSGETRYFVSENPTGDEDSDFAAVLSQFKAKLAEHVAPEDADAHYDLGLAFKEMGLFDEAIEQFQVALRTGDARLRIYEELGDCFLQKQQPSVAIKLLTRALEIPTADEMERVGIYYHLGMAWERLGRNEEARDAYERVVGLDMGFRDVSQRLRRL